MEKETAVIALAALAQACRLDIFRLLVESGPAGLSAGRIGALLSVPPATLSFHLKELKNAGLVAVRRDGRSLIYAADFGTMNQLLGYLTDSCCGGNPQLCVATGAVPATASEPRRKQGGVTA